MYIIHIYIWYAFTYVKNRMWDEICENTYQFTRREEESEIIKLINKNQILAFYDHFLLGILDRQTCFNIINNKLPFYKHIDDNDSNNNNIHNVDINNNANNNNNNNDNNNS